MTENDDIRVCGRAVSMNYFFLLFKGFETLDLFGPVEIFGRTPCAGLNYVSTEGGVITSAQGAQINTVKADILPCNSVLLIPGGMGTRILVNDAGFIRRIRELADSAEYVLSVCTGSALLAAAGLLKGRKATSNKYGFEWVKSTGDAEWVGNARWVHCGKYYTSSGVSAGIDMALGFVADIYGRDIAEENARKSEYLWNDNADNDPFAI